MTENYEEYKSLGGHKNCKPIIGLGDKKCMYASLYHHVTAFSAYYCYIFYHSAIGRKINSSYHTIEFKCLTLNMPIKIDSLFDAFCPKLG